MWQDECGNDQADSHPGFVGLTPDSALLPVLHHSSFILHLFLTILRKERFFSLSIPVPISINFVISLYENTFTSLPVPVPCFRFAFSRAGG
jgi:hypothetical protein